MKMYGIGEKSQSVYALYTQLLEQDSTRRD